MTQDFTTLLMIVGGTLLLIVLAGVSTFLNDDGSRRAGNQDGNAAGNQQPGNTRTWSERFSALGFLGSTDFWIGGTLLLLLAGFGVAWHEVLLELPNMSQLEQIMTTAWILFTVAAHYGFWLIRKEPTLWPKRALYVAITGVMLLGGSVFVYGERAVLDPLGQHSVNIRTNEPAYMVYLENNGTYVFGYENGERLRPSDCRPARVSHQGFNYATKGTCFSPTGDGTRMIPQGPEHRMVLPDLNPFSSEAEKRAKSSNYSGSSATPREVTPTPTKTVYVPVAPDYATALPKCDDHRYVGKIDCTKVNFEAGQVFVFKGRTGHCRIAKSFGGAGLTASTAVLGNLEREYRAQGRGIGYFFNAPIGQDGCTRNLSV